MDRDRRQGRRNNSFVNDEDITEEDLAAIECRPYKRKTAHEEPDTKKPKNEEPTQASQLPAMQQKTTQETISIIRSKLSAPEGGPKQPQRRTKNQMIMAQVKTPVIVTNRVGAGVTAEKLQRAQEEHTKKLMKWRYDALEKSYEKKTLQKKK